jgi:hypothetical protein
MGLLDFLEKRRQAHAAARQAREVKRLLVDVYSLSHVNHRDIVEFVVANQMMLLGWASTFDLTVLYLTCLLDTADRTDPRGREMAEHWIAATDHAAKQGVKISGRMLQGLAEAARLSYGVGGEEAVEGKANG